MIIPEHTHQGVSRPCCPAWLTSVTTIHSQWDLHLPLKSRAEPVLLKRTRVGGKKTNTQGKISNQIGLLKLCQSVQFDSVSSLLAVAYAK